MPANERTPVRNPITHFQRDFSLLPDLSALSARALLLVTAGAGILTVAGATALLMHNPPKPTEEKPASQPVFSYTFEQAPKGQRLSPISMSGAGYDIFLRYPDSNLHYVDCSINDEETKGEGLKLYADHIIGSKRFEAPTRIANEVNPPFPKSEPMFVKDLLQIESAVGKSLWAIDPQAAEGRMPKPSYLRQTYVLVYEILNGQVTNGASLVGDLNKCRTLKINKP